MQEGFSLDLTDYDGSGERRLVIAAVTSTEFLSRVAEAGGESPFASAAANRVWSWCRKHHKKYRVCPGGLIARYHEEYARAATDRKEAELVERLLQSLSDEADAAPMRDAAYALDLAKQVWNRVRLVRHQETLRERLERGQVDAALEEAAAFKPLALCPTPWIDVLKDREAQRRALEDSQKVLIRYPGAAGVFFGDELAEDSFVAFMAPSKGAKSFWLLDTAWRAVFQGRRVAYFQVGDLTEGQVMRRFHKRACGRPIKSTTASIARAISLPPEAKGLTVVDRETKTWQGPLTWEQAEARYEHLCRKARGELRLVCHPTKTVSASGIDAVLESWTQAGWPVQVCVIDYAGNLAPDGRADRNDLEVEETWGRMRRISEERKCLVVTAQQANKEGFKAWVLTKNNFSQSKMILAHVTAFFGINRTEEEYQAGISRINTVVSREGLWSETQCLYAGSSLDVANPCSVSAFAGAQ